MQYFNRVITFWSLYLCLSVATIFASEQKSYIVILNEFSDVNEVSKDLKRTHNIIIGHKYQNVLNGFSFKGSSQAVEAIGKRWDVESIEEDGIVTAFKGPPPGRGGGGSIDDDPPPQVIPEGILRVNGPVSSLEDTGTAWVIDSGIDLDHPDLNVNVSKSISFLSGKQGSSADDQNGHGTHVAGIIAALDNEVGVVGVVPNAVLVSVRVLDRRGSGTVSGVIAGVDYVATHGSVGDVANMSLGGAASESLDIAVINAAASGIIFVLAAGNESADANLFSPARANGDNIYTISAIDQRDTFAYFSNFGNPPVDFSAPGVSILSTYKNGGYDTFNGTSMAAPHAAGVLLLTKGSPGQCGIAIQDPDLVPDPIICIR